jgi:sugar-specific transcriptional regulator TrmB
MEINSYLCLVDLGEVTIGPITHYLKWHRQVAYDALDSLIAKNMVRKSNQG